MATATSPALQRILLRQRTFHTGLSRSAEISFRMERSFPFSPFSSSSSVVSQPTKFVGPNRWRELRAARKAAPPPKRRSAYKFDRSACWAVEEALVHLRKSSWAHFDETVELVFRLNVDPRHADQIVRAVASLPHGRGREVKVVVFADGQKAQEAVEAGADVVGGAELVQQLKETKGRILKDFDGSAALPEMMDFLAGKVGRLLAPKGLLPSAKIGTITDKVGEMVKDLKAGRSVFKVDKFGNVHTVVGKMSFSDQMLTDNIMEVTRAIMAAKPSSIKKKYVLGVSICSSMGPGVRLREDLLVKLALAQAD